MNNTLIKLIIQMLIWIPICIIFGYASSKRPQWGYTYGVAAMGIMNIITAIIFR